MTSLKNQLADLARKGEVPQPTRGQGVVRDPQGRFGPSASASLADRRAKKEADRSK